MEFKKPHKINRVQPPRSASRPIDPSFITHRPHPTRSAPPIVTNPIQAPSPVRIQTREQTREPQVAQDHPSLRDVLVLYVRRFKFKKKIIIISSGILIAIVAGVVILSINQRNLTNGANRGNTNEIVQDLEYQTILPDGKSISELGGWKRVSPDKAAPVYAYADTIDGKSINVSEQPLPDSFIGDTDEQVADLAKKFNATTKIQAGDIKVYVGSSSRGPQSVIFTKNSLLILIKSQEKIDDAAWIRYIRSLN
jgi:hypothetical protein